MSDRTFGLEGNTSKWRPYSAGSNTHTNPIIVKGDDVQVTVTSLTDNQQKETIVWHKYPDEKPMESKGYLIQVPRQIGITFEMAYYPVREGRWGVKDVIAWAELPKGWK